MEPELIFKDRNNHELYTAGHLIEAAIAYHKATGKRKMLDIMIKNVECIEKAFITEKTAGFITGGHEEIELALIKLYDHTGDKKYLDICMFFLDNRGVVKEGPVPHDRMLQEFCQSHLPVREQSVAMGHAVRAAYLYTGMIEAAERSGDQGLYDACERLFNNIITERMYITGGIGSASRGESFTVGYDLPNLEAYSESCAAIGLMIFAHGMQKKNIDSKYADVVERVLYNNLLSSVSMDGTSFFYENPLEINLASLNTETCVVPHDRKKMPITQRVKVFGCSCCPPNINRMLARVGDFFFSEIEEALIVNQYGALTLDNGNIKLTMETAYPSDGKVRLVGKANKYGMVMLRRPWWCSEYTLEGGEVIKEENGFICVNVGESFRLELDLKMKPVFIRTSSKVRYDCGRVALCYGPTVYCIERIDNDYELNALSVDTLGEVRLEEREGVLELVANGCVERDIDMLYAIDDNACERVTLRYRPYRTFANRGESDMLVWVRRKYV